MRSIPTLLLAALATAPLTSQCVNVSVPIAAVTGFTRTIHDSLTMPDGSVIVAGDFTGIGGVPASCLARWHDGVWSEYAGGLAVGGIGISLARMSNGDLVVGGWFTVGPTAIQNLARWNGTSWSAFGAGPGGTASEFVQKVHVEANGDLIVGGLLPGGIRRWNGTTWTSLGAAPLTCWDINRLPNGDLVAAGQWRNDPTTVRRWDGVAWVSIGGTGWSGAVGQPAIGTRILPGDAGSFVLGGWFQSTPGGAANNIARWDGATWSSMGTGVPGLVRDLVTLPNGDLAAMGYFNEIRRWHATQWTQMANLVRAYTASPLPNDDLLLASMYSVERLTTSCPAGVALLTAGCSPPSSLGTLAWALPWTGSTWTCTASGLPTNTLVAVAYGTSPLSQPLASVLPQAPPGCLLRVSPAFVDLTIASGTQVQSSLALPDTPALAGQVFYQQMVVLGLGPGGSLVSANPTNGLALTIGAF